MKARVVQVCAGHLVDDTRVFHRTAKTLAEHGFEVHLIGRADRPCEPVVDGVHIHPIKTPKSFAERLARRRRVARLAMSLQPDVLHVHEPELLGPMLRVAGNVPVLWDVHEAYLAIIADRAWVPDWARPVVRAWWDRSERRALPKCAAVIAATDGVASRYRDLHPHVTVVANYPDIEVVPRSYGLHGNRPRMVFTGTIDQNRGVTQSIDALQILRSRGLDVDLDLAGTPALEAYVSELLARAAEIGVADLVTHHGPVSRPEAIALQRNADIGLVPHLRYGNNLEAWPVKMMEYMAVGLPLVYSGLPSHRAIAGGRVIGVEIEPTAEAIADAVTRLVASEQHRAAMGRAGQALVREQLNWECEWAKLDFEYRRVLRSDRPLDRVG